MAGFFFFLFILLFKNVDRKQQQAMACRSVSSGIGEEPCIIEPVISGSIWLCFKVAAGHLTLSSDTASLVWVFAGCT